MRISPNTKIATLLNHSPEALEAIVSISPKFTKLRNKVLRKVIGGRTSIAMASKIGGCTVDDFFKKLLPLGFEIEASILPAEEGIVKDTFPEFLKNIDPDTIIELDVRPVFETGKDPLNVILKKVKTLEAGSVLKIINGFEPTPLRHLLGNQDFESYAEHISDELVYTYFYKKAGNTVSIKEINAGSSNDWDAVLTKFNDNLETLDVRGLEMPLPMHMILGSLKDLPTGKALFVYHKRIPVFLLPELDEQKFSYRIKEISDGEVHLLIYKD